MSQLQTINVGNIANDGTGDDLREAFIKVNENLLYLENSTLEPAIEGNNLGNIGEGIYASKNGNTLNFKSLTAGNNITISSNPTSITIDSAGGISDIVFMTDDGNISFYQSDPADPSVPILNIFGKVDSQNKQRIKTEPSSGNTVLLELAEEGIVSHDNKPKLSANLQADGNNIQNVGNINALSIQGALEGTVYDVDIRDINQYFSNNWEFGYFLPVIENNQQITSFLEYLIYQQDVDLGTFEGTGVAQFDIDLGTLSDV